MKRAMWSLALIGVSIGTAEAQQQPTRWDVGGGLGIVGTQAFLDNVDTGARAHGFLSRSLGARIAVEGQFAISLHGRTGCFLTGTSSCPQVAGFALLGVGPRLSLGDPDRLHPFVTVRGGVARRWYSEPGTGWYASINPGVRIPVAAAVQLEIGLDLSVLGLGRTIPASEPGTSARASIRDYAQTTTLTFGIVRRLGGR